MHLQTEPESGENFGLGFPGSEPMRQPLEKPVTPSDPPVQWCEVDGMPVSYTDEGPAGAATFVLVHGVPGSVADFRYLAPLLATDFRVVRLEFPGFGSNLAAADIRPYPGSPPARAAFIIACAKKLGLDRLCVVGHSMGGPAALCAAALAPERVHALGLIASVGLRKHRGMAAPPWMVRVNAPLMRVPLLRRGFLNLARAAYGKMGFRKEAAALTVEAFATHSRVIGAIRFSELIHASTQIHCKALVMAAVDDPLIEPEIPRELAEQLADARTKIFPSGGHNIQKTRARALASALKTLHT